MWKPYVLSKAKEWIQLQIETKLCLVKIVSSSFLQNFCLAQGQPSLWQAGQSIFYVPWSEIPR